MLPCELSCPKCGSSDVLREHFAAGSERKLLGTEPVRRYENNGVFIRVAWREYLNHHCRCCQYVWQTPPLPKRKGKPTPAAASADARKQPGEPR